MLEWHIRIGHLKPDAAGQFWYSHDFVKDAIVLRESLQITVPSGKYVKVSSPELKPEVRETGGRKTYSWIRSQLSRPKDEDTEKKIKPRTRPRPAVQITTFRSWEEVGRWYATLQQPKVEVTPAVQARAAELTRGLNTNLEKQRAIYQFVASKFRYISISFGDGWYQPHSATEVLANQYGDCKDKHTLLATLLKAAGIEAWPALLGAGNTVDPDVPSPAQFNHLITYLPDGKSGIWLDSTPEVAPYGMLDSSDLEQHALVIPDQGVPVLKNTPDTSLFLADEKIGITAKLASDGTLTGHFEITARGGGELFLRTLFHASAPKDWATLGQRLSESMGFGGTVRNLDIANPLETATPFHLAYNYERKNYPDWEHRQISPPMPPLAFSYSGDEDPPTEPLLIGSPGAYVYRTTTELPEGYSVEIPADAQVDTPFAAYRSTYSFDKGVLTVERALTFKRSKLAVNEWEDYRKFVKSAAADQDQFIRLVRAGTVTGSTVVRDNPEAAQLLQNAVQALQRQEINSARDALAQAERLNPQQNGLWAVYAMMYALQGQKQKAIDALKKEIELHPGNEAMYRLLAAAQQESGQREEQIATLTKLVKIAPQNADGALDLASALMAEKKYAEAVAPLEGALKANPQEPRVELKLLEAQLRQGNKADGLAVLANLRKQISDPDDLNSAAYVLADTNTDIAAAKDLSEKAAAQFADQIKSVTLGTVTNEYFKLVNTLGATWDTVGWSYFRSGDLVKAETYIKAAWLLLQHPAAADHLGQIYERQGKKTEAVHAYQLSLAAQHDQPDVQKRLESLGGKEDDAPVTLRRGKPVGEPHLSPDEELSKLRTTPLPELPSRMASAEFFLLFSAAGVQDVRFIRGDEALKGAGGVLAKAHFQMPFPDQGPEKIVRRGILSCSTYTMPSCTFVLLLPANTTAN